MSSGLHVENSVDQLRVAVYHAALRVKPTSAAVEVDTTLCVRRLIMILQGEGYDVEVKDDPAGKVTHLCLNKQLAVQLLLAGEPDARSKGALIRYLREHQIGYGLQLDFRNPLMLDGVTLVVPDPDPAPRSLVEGRAVKARSRGGRRTIRKAAIFS